MIDQSDSLAELWSETQKVEAEKVDRNNPQLLRTIELSPMSDTETLDGGRTSPTHGGRHEKSLGILTSKFVDLLQAAEGGVLDLKKVLYAQLLLLIL